MADTFDDAYVQRLAKILDNDGKSFAYRTDEFVNPHNPLWPQQSFDYPYGQAPEVDDLPPEERADWEEHVRTHYLKAAFGSADAWSQPLANQASDFVVGAIGANASRVYPDLDEDTFTSMVVEGVFSQFLCPLDPIDVERFGPSVNDPTFLKCDLSCMQVVKKTSTWPGEYVYPTVVVVQRAKAGSIWGRGSSGYKVIGIDIWDASTATDDSAARKDPDPNKSRVLKKDAIQTADDKELWRRAKYFVLQGCLHRFNLIDHMRVHFPHDTINAVTKSVLPKWHFVQQLLMPHFWLTLPVNHAMLEGDRSLINRDTWYPWSPFAAKGDEIRKLLPFSWSGNDYYYPGVKNTAYPPYSFRRDPIWVKDDAGPLSGTAPAAFCPSAFRAMQFELYAGILQFVKDVIAATLPLPPPTSTDQADILWLEIKRWAHEISRFLPGFPDENDICHVDANGKPDYLANVIAMVIWNASVVHSYDHGALHTMMNDPTKPKPFVMRVPWASTFPTVGDYLDSIGRDPNTNRLKPGYTGSGKDLAKSLLISLGLPVDPLTNAKFNAQTYPLCSAADVLYAKMADLLFYAPHNSTLLYDCAYAFESNDVATQFAYRPVAQLTKTQRDAISAARTALKRIFDDLDNSFFPASGDTPEAQLGFPRTLPPDKTKPPGFITWNDDDKKAFRARYCIAAGIQY